LQATPRPADRGYVVKACILAGGFGTRLSEETDKLPKPMVEIGHRPMLWHVMRTLANGGVSDFCVAGGYRQDRIKSWAEAYPRSSGDLRVDFSQGTIETTNSDIEAWTITVADTGLETATGGRLLRLRPYLEDDTFLLTYGDGVANVDLAALLATHRSGPYLATVTAVLPPARFGALTIEGDRVVDFAEKAPFRESYINGGYMVFEPSIFDRIRGDETVLEADVLTQLAQEGQLGAHIHRGFWMPMDTLRDKRVLERLWETGERPWLSTG
jgi:glucose-1-phosphate cytidylyltransferase